MENKVSPKEKALNMIKTTLGYMKSYDGMTYSDYAGRRVKDAKIVACMICNEVINNTDGEIKNYYTEVVEAIKKQEDLWSPKPAQSGYGY